MIIEGNFLIEENMTISFQKILSNQNFKTTTFVRNKNNTDFEHFDSLPAVSTCKHQDVNVNKIAASKSEGNNFERKMGTFLR